MRKLIVGNWKMNGLRANLDEIALLGKAGLPDTCDVLICLPFTLLPLCAERFSKSAIKFGGQDCHSEKSGAHTGDVSAVMLKDAGASYVIVGHSERRQNHGETNAIVKSKAEAALAAGLTPIICVGETRVQREAGQAESVVEQQLRESAPSLSVIASERSSRGDPAKNNKKLDCRVGAIAPPRNDDNTIIVAYEPVWAIGTGLTPGNDDIAAMHSFIRDQLGNKKTRLLYGGSVKGSNAKEILSLPNVDGALVGGASLKAKEFMGIILAV